MKNVLNIVLNNFTNDSRVLKTAMTLNELGYPTTVVAYHDDGLQEEELIQGVKVKRLKLKTKEWGKHPFIQLLKFFEFIFFTILLSRRYEIAHVNDLQGLIVGFFLKIFKPSLRIVYDSHEWQIDHVPYQSERRRRFLYVIEKIFIKVADVIIVVSDSIANEYVKVYGVKKPYLLLNCPYYSKVSKTDIYRETFDISENVKIFLYQGALKKGRGIESLIDVFKSMSDEPICIIFMGYGDLVPYIRQAEKASENIYYHDAVSPDVVYRYTSAADVGICLIEDCCLSYRYCLPNKLFEYTMAGLPVLVSELPELSSFVRSNGNGMAVDANNIDQVHHALKKLSQDSSSLQEMTANANELAKIYNWNQQAKVLEEIYQDL
ncbi:MULTISPECIES: glycosyltransferase [Acinetobacter]|uniref:Glycosyltransferase family 4 protein n=1 Tax=Acinetobacter suaedae TaxID=2609668 RepID=A0A5P1UW71_9GAMM|nr:MULTISPECIES: glycosyltransferase [Acinetobacter]MEB6677087.1 glycosyltransferase [Acinetobacter haemolyticus]QER40985.1 glycosyltransferase family 4 protein [Acinetobacter sp. C16S1]